GRAGLVPFDLLPPLLGGAVVTLALTFTSAGLALALALGAGLGRLSRWPAVRTAAAVYVEVFRGSSLLVQLFYFFFVLPLLGIRLPPFATGVLALGLNIGAYGSEVVRAAGQGVHPGPRDAPSRQTIRAGRAPRQL